MTTAPLQSRFQILDRPLRHPGKCAVCGSATKPVVDMGITIMGYGVVYFCVEDLTDLASVIGMVSESDVSGLRLAAEQSFDEYLTTRNLKVVTNEWYDSITSAVGGLLAVADDPGIYFHSSADGSAGTEVPEDAGQHDDAPVADNTLAGQDSIVAVEEGPASVSADSSDGSAGTFEF